MLPISFIVSINNSAGVYVDLDFFQKVTVGKVK